MKLGINNTNVNYSGVRNWIASLRPKIKCFFKGHKPSYSLGWGKGNYDDIHIVCDRCTKEIYMFHHSDVGPWKDRITDLQKVIEKYRQEAHKG